ncbi:MAG: acyl-CoA thioesterase, partial [Ilumatobacteraceae bacterium]
PYRWWMPVTRSLCTGGNFLFGGCGLGAAISAMEGTTGREVVWATSQYLSYATPGEVMDIDVTVAVAGHQISQARAVCHVGNREILTVNAALGHRPMDQRGQWVEMPEVPPPDQCYERPHRMPVEGTIHERMEQRLALGREAEDLDGTLGDGQVVMWAQVPDVIESETHLVDATTLAVLGDFVPMGVGQALGRMGGGNSLDNTIRLGKLVPTQWVLLDIRVHAVEHGFGHGLVHMFAEDGTLLATASQSCIVRSWTADVPPAPRS